MKLEKKNRTELRSYFVKNSIPTESNFADLIDGMLNQKEDGIFKLTSRDPLSIVATGDPTSQQKLINFYQSLGDPDPAWMLNLSSQGFSIGDGQGMSRLFIDRNTGNVGIGTTDPQAKLHVTGNAGVLNLEGTDHAYIQWFPDKSNPGRKAWIGFGGPHDEGFYIANEYKSKMVHIRANLTVIGGNIDSTGTTVQIEGNNENVGLYMGADLNHPWIGSRTNHGLRIVTNSSEKIRITAEGNVGIGTTNPDHSLTIANAVGTNYMNVKDGTREILMGVDEAGGILSTVTNHDLQLRAGGNSTKMVIKADGKIGIGTLSPEMALHVTNDLAVGPFSMGPAVGRLMLTGPFAGLGFAKRTLTAWPETPVAGDRFVWYNPDGSARLYTDVMGDLVSVTSTGGVGIGTMTPNAKLTVALQTPGDGIFIDSGNNMKAVALFTNNGPGAWNPLTQEGDHLLLWKGAAIDDPGAGLVIAPWRSSASGIRIDANGNVGIGTTNPENYKLDVNGNLEVTGSIHFGATLSTPSRMHITGEEILFLLNKNGVVIGKEWGGNGNLIVEGDLSIGGNLTVEGAQQNIIKVVTFPKAVMNNGHSPGTWSITYSGFSEVYAVFAVLQGYSLYNNQDNLNFDKFDYETSGNGYTQHVYVKVNPGYNTTSASGEVFCSEATKDWEFDNTVLFTVVVMGRG